MGSDRCTRGKLVARCCHGAFFGFGFVFTVFTIVAMFWIAWCYFGLVMIKSSESQRRAAVDWSNGSSKSPLLPTPTTTASPLRSVGTSSAAGENSGNSISKLPTTESLLRGSSRGESPQVRFDKRKATVMPSSSAKGDFAPRDRAAATSPGDDATASLPPKAAFASTVPSPRGPPKSEDESEVVTSGERASILAGSGDSEEEDRRIHARRVSAPGPENRPPEGETTVGRSRPDISPTKGYETAMTIETARAENSPTRPSETRSGDYPDRREIQSSRRSDTEPSATAYRDPDFDREYPSRHSTSYVRGDPRYDDSEDGRGSRGRYDESRDRGRESDDRLSKGDTRVYPDDRDPPPVEGIRYSARDPEELSRRGDDDRYDDRYRDYDDRPRYRETRYRVRDDRPSSSRDERYGPRDEPKYRPGDRYRSREDDRYAATDDERYRYRDDRYRDEERSRDDDRYRTRDDDRHPSDSDKRDDYRPRGDAAKYGDTARPRDSDIRDSSARSTVDERKLSSSRTNYETRTTDYDRSRTRARDGSSRPSYDEDRYRERDRDDDYRRPSRYDDEDRQIAPTRTRNDYSLSKSSLMDSRSRESGGNSRYIVNERDRVKDTYYDEEDRFRNTRLQGSRNSSPVGESSRRYPDDDERYRTRLPNERNDSPKGKEEVVLDRRSYASEGSDEYRKKENSRFDDAYDDRTRIPVDERRRPVDETRRPVDEPRRPVDEPRRTVDERRRLDDESRRYKDEEGYSRRDPVDDQYKRSRPRDDYERDRSRNRDRYDDGYRPYDDRYPSREERLPPLPMRKYDTSDDEGSTRREADVGTLRKEGSRPREEDLRPSPSYRDDQRSHDRGEYTDSKSSSRRRFIDHDSSLPESDTREQTDTSIREKRFPTSDGKSQSSRPSGGNSRSFHDLEVESEQVRPLSMKEVLEVASRHSDGPDQNVRKVHYPVHDPRIDPKSPEVIRPGDRRGTTISFKKRRSA